MDDLYVPLVQDRSPINAVKYAGRDYASIFDSLVRRVKIEYGDTFNDYATTGQGVMLMDLMAYACDEIQWYIDRTASDCFLRTARTRAAVAALVEQIGYKMRPAASAAADLVLTFPNGTPASFTFQARRRFLGPDSIQYESIADIPVSSAIPPGGTLSVPVRQGDSRLLTFTSDGAKNQTYRMTGVGDGQYVSDGGVEVWVDGSPWTEKAFLEYEKTNHFEVTYLGNPPFVRFGDGNAGNVPPLGAEVKIRYVIIRGESGNVKSGTITKFVDTLVVAGESVTVEVTNPNGASGGIDPELADKAKRLAPFYFAARGAAITQQDYEALSNGFVDPVYGAVAKAYAISPRTSYDDIIFNGYLSIISGLVDAYVLAAGALESSINSSAVSISALSAQQVAGLDDLEEMRTTMVGQSGAVLSALGDVSEYCDRIESHGDLAVSTLGGVETQVADLIAYVTSNVSDPEKTYILNALNEIDSDVSLAKNKAQDASNTATAASSASVSAETICSQLNYLVNEQAPVSPQETMYSLIESVRGGVAAISAVVSSIQADASELAGKAEDLKAAVDPALADMRSRIGTLFSDDCMSNYVQVPILALDVEGNYVSPSSGLVLSLQAYLNKIKEVTQQVEVVDGTPNLLPAEISISVRVNDEAIAEEALSAVRKTVIGMLKRRDFNSPLYLDELYDNSKKSHGGIRHVNVEITGPTGVLPYPFDSDGNLIGQPGNIITLGSLSVTKIKG